MRLAISIGTAVFLLAAHVARGEPMSLVDPAPRTVSVRFENSPPDAPDRLGATFTAEIPARFAFDRQSDRVRVSIAGADIERDYFTHQRLQPGSFSDYVWIFDPHTGDVESASLSGVLVRRFDLGFFQKDVETHFEATLTTRVPAGFGTPRHVFGQLVLPLCDHAASDCTIVPAVRYDARTGYVNAVGWIGGHALGISARTFAPIGEAIFSERPEGRAAGLADVH